MKILVLIDSRYTGESPIECSANYHIMMGMENYLLSSEVTLLYSDSKIQLGLQNFPPLNNNQIKVSCTYPIVRL